MQWRSATWLRCGPTTSSCPMSAGASCPETCRPSCCLSWRLPRCTQTRRRVCCSRCSSRRPSCTTLGCAFQQKRHVNVTGSWGMLSRSFTPCPCFAACFHMHRARNRTHREWSRPRDGACAPEVTFIAACRCCEARAMPRALRPSAAILVRSGAAQSGKLWCWQIVCKKTVCGTAGMS